MTGKTRGQKKQNKNNRKKSRRDEDHVEEPSTRNDSDDLADRNESRQENETEHMSATSEECQPLPPDELYFQNTEYTKTTKIQSKCLVSKTVALIKDLKTELVWFENHPQFSHIFHMPDEQFLKLLSVWMLLLRTIPLEEGEETAWFAVNGVPIRYSMREHALISGLDCHEYPGELEKLGSYAFVNRHFNSHAEITMKSVEEKLKSMSACGDRLKMAVLYFLGTVIRGKGKYNAPFDPFILRIVNNLEDCKTFPWGRLTFDDAIRTVKHAMKKLKGKVKANVNFPGFIIPLQMLAFECIPTLNAQFRERVPGCVSTCPRMCKWEFVSNSMKGYPLEDLYDALGQTNKIQSVLTPTVDEEILLARIMEAEPDYENEDGPCNLWNTWLTVKQKPIWWKNLYDLDVAARNFSEKKGKSKKDEEASSSNANLEDVLKETEERMMACLSEVNVKVDTMDKRLGVLEKSHKIMKRRAKKMKAIEKRRARKQKAMEERLDGIENEMKKKKENENSYGNDYQTMDFGWNERRREEAEEEEKGCEKEDEEVEMNDEKQDDEVEVNEKQDDEVEVNEGKEIEEESSESESDHWTLKQMMETCRVQAAKIWKDIDAAEKVDEGGVEVETDTRVDAESEVVETEAQEPETEAAKDGVETRRNLVDVFYMEEIEKEAQEPETEAAKDGVETNDGVEAENMVGEKVEEPETEAVKYTEEEMQKWYMVVYEGAPAVDKTGGAPAVDKTGGTEGAPARTGIKRRPKQMAVRKHAPKGRGRPRKAAEPKKFITPEPTKRTRSRSQWVSSPFTEADTDEIEGGKKKPRTKA